MAAITGISWTKSTFNPWIGCTKVGPGCDHCYAESRMDSRLHIVNWGPGQPRKRTRPANWNGPVKWNAEAPSSEFAGIKGYWPVFCSSLADVFDNEVPEDWRIELFELIRATPNLTWQLLTKRIGNAKKMIDRVISTLDIGHDPAFAAWPWPNVWIGATVVNQEEADRDVPKLLDVPAAKRFVSIEPMLGPIDLKRITTKTLYPSLEAIFVRERNALYSGDNDGLDWVICGGESGKDARPMHPDWARSLRDQCVNAGVPYFFKQWGEYVPAAWFDGPDSLGDDEECCFDPEKEPHAFIANDGRQWDTNGGRYMYPPLPLGHWCLMRRVGTKAAGNLLDGKAWQQFPDSVA